MMNKRYLKIGFIGAGRVADVHYNALQECGEVAQLAAFCDLRPEAVYSRQKEWGVPGFASIATMLDSVQLDAVVALVPHNIHLDVMKKCLERKLPVLLEKPIAAKMEEALEITRLSDEAGVPVLVGHNGLFHPSLDRIVKFVSEGWIGKPLMASAKSLQWLDFRPWDFRKSLEQTGGGAWMDCAGHLIYRLNAILGEVQDVTGFVSHQARDEMEGEDTAIAVLRFASGVIGHAVVSYGCKLPGYEKDWPSGCEQMLMVSGDKGMVEYHICPDPHIRYYTELEGCEIAKPGVWEEVAVDEPFETSFTEQMRHFLECVNGKQKCKVTPMDATRLLKTLLKLYENQEN
ncbi:MAG: hypothetical protein A2W90_07195 [Bacteroidetes bacterium GWF2_42_66]|nr:MAG: hypothetical protein A2W89_19895 [Bacteroidetes bacterium GWE2_42_39]OFY44636.1 MAG: hypothetical protein A2W90_07195 [Bacteroidetes bacterium GWF2_42_66]